MHNVRKTGQSLRAIIFSPGERLGEFLRPLPWSLQGQSSCQEARAHNFHKYNHLHGFFEVELDHL
jgi:hypothetical protein